ncbi:MAG: hypothetical protein U0X93_04150 [Anaerolineales bacterium]
MWPVNSLAVRRPTPPHLSPEIPSIGFGCVGHHRHAEWTSTQAWTRLSLSRSAKRVWLTRAVPLSSLSFHICAPPAPQQNDLAELRGISMVNAPVDFKRLARRIEDLVVHSPNNTGHGMSP